MKSKLLAPLLVALTVAPAAVAQTDSRIHVLEQRGNELEILVDHAGSGLATLQITDGAHVDRARIPAGREHRHTYEVPSGGLPLRQRTISLELLDEQGQLLVGRQASVIDPVELGETEPLLTLTATEIRSLRKKWRLDSRIAEQFDRLKRRNDRRLGNRLLVPKTGGAWPQLYRCPDTHVRLEMVDFHHHRSPTTGKVFSGSPYDEAITTYRHRALGVQAFEMALGYQLTGDLRYAERAERILLTYALLYPDFELHDRFGTTKRDAGRAFSQTLEEAQWLVDLARARDLLRGSGLIDAADDLALRTRLFEPALDVILKNDVGIYNIQNWHNTALFLAGIEAGRLDCARAAAHGPTGLAAQLAQGVQPDGLWMEGSIGYHFFTIRGMLPMIHAAERINASLDLEPLRGMFVAAWDLMQPDYTLPTLNDGAQENFEISLRDEYEQALALFPAETCFNDVLVAFGRGNSLAAVLWGAPQIRNEDWTDVASVHFPDSGLGVLRSGPRESRTMALVDHGPHGGFHGHHDKLGLTLWMHGRPAIREAGAEGYGQSISDSYFRSTLAHSTIVVDGMDQQPASGEASYFSTAEGHTLSSSCDSAYPGVTLRRLVHVTEEGHAGDMFEAVSNQSHTYDYVLHGVGEVNTSLQLEPVDPGFGGAYGYLRNVRGVQHDGDIEVSFTQDGEGAQIKIAGEPGTEVFLAESPGAPIGTWHPVLIVRRTGERAVFAAGFSEAAPTPGFWVDVDAQSWEAVLEVQRPGAPDLRRLGFSAGPGI